MDRISLLPDELLLRILSLLPTTKDAVATMVLSQRWLPLWKLMRKLVYDDSYQNIEYGKFSRFVDRSLILHEAPVDTLHFKLVKNSVLLMLYNSSHASKELIHRVCTLVTLKLKSVTLVDVSSLPSFPTLKKLWLLFVKYPGDEFVKRLLSNCHVLQDMIVVRVHNDNVTVFTVVVSSLKTLRLGRMSRNVKEGVVIDAPLLEILDIYDDMGGFCVIENDMPKIVKAGFYVTYSQPGKMMSCITSVKCLTLCLSTSKEVYPVGAVFHNLLNLNLCTCQTEWLSLLLCMLRGCPNLQSLRLFKIQSHKLPAAKPRPCLKGPTSVPGCLSSSLKTLIWVAYEGREEEKQVAALILRSGSCLKKVTIFSKATNPNRKLEMLKELSSIPMRSPTATCSLIFY
ncbi:unnamed protein product [Microthlaspi erraticum]|uniref:FBD domain-containing protein n=1 Tax=Microthlaspi erraticum TaxID=1685480 RepID=A0A6D2IVY8_9BRAS|nr:unnamed protein product [Microthlaspi erraticum]